MCHRCGLKALWRWHGLYSVFERAEMQKAAKRPAKEALSSCERGSFAGRFAAFWNGACNPLDVNGLQKADPLQWKGVQACRPSSLILFSACVVSRIFFVLLHPVLD